ncbi:MAG: ATP-binding protein [Candidatus Thiothrix sulfatifontis]|nr:MAG: ATP-binding protein [Candidatus Thiothrix sulfatifontis]
MLDSLHIKNFRCFEDLTIPSLGRVNLIVGRNNSGKSTLLEAISIFAQDGSTKSIKNLLNKRHEFFNGSIYQDNKKNIIIKSDKKTLSLFTEYDENIGEIYTSEASLSDNDSDIREHQQPFAMVKSQLAHENDLAQQWDTAYLDSEEHIIKDILTIFNADITNVIFVQSPEKKDERVAVLKIKGKAKAVPLKAMGEGVSRVLQLFLSALRAKGGYLLIDEFENGLHYSIQEEIWKKLFYLAKELDLQVFATTHSEDTVTAFATVAVADKEVDGKLITLGRSAGKSNRGQIIAHVYSEDRLDWIVNSGMEIR